MTYQKPLSREGKAKEIVVEITGNIDKDFRDAVEKFFYERGFNLVSSGFTRGYPYDEHELTFQPSETSIWR